MSHFLCFAAKMDLTWLLYMSPKGACSFAPMYIEHYRHVAEASKNASISCCTFLSTVCLSNFIGPGFVSIGLIAGLALSSCGQTAVLGLGPSVVRIPRFCLVSSIPKTTLALEGFHYQVSSQLVFQVFDLLFRLCKYKHFINQHTIIICLPSKSQGTLCISLLPEASNFPFITLNNIFPPLFSPHQLRWSVNTTFLFYSLQLVVVEVQHSLPRQVSHQERVSEVKVFQLQFIFYRHAENHFCHCMIEKCEKQSLSFSLPLFCKNHHT